MFWMGAVAAAIVEVLVRFATEPGGFVAAISSSSAEIGVRLAAHAILITLASLMRRGRNCARHLLTIVFGGLGIFSLTFEPIAWLADGGQVSTFLAGADPAMWAMIARSYFRPERKR